MKFFEICAEVLVPKFTRAEVRLPGPDLTIKPMYKSLQSFCALSIADFGTNEPTAIDLSSGIGGMLSKTATND